MDTEMKIRLSIDEYVELGQVIHDVEISKTLQKNRVEYFEATAKILKEGTNLRSTKAVNAYNEDILMIKDDIELSSRIIKYLKKLQSIGSGFIPKT